MAVEPSELSGGACLHDLIPGSPAPDQSVSEPEGMLRQWWDDAEIIAARDLAVIP